MTASNQSYSYLAPSGMDPDADLSVDSVRKIQYWLHARWKTFQTTSAPSPPSAPQVSMASSDGLALIAKGEKSLQGSGSYFSWTGLGKKPDKDQAAEYFQKAGDAFASENQFIEAAKAHERAAELHQECDSPTFAGQQFLQAAFCYRKKEERGDDMQGGDMQSAARCYQKASQIFARAGNWPSAAKAQNDLGLLIEIEFEDYKAAVEAFERAAEWYAMGRQPATAVGPWKKVGDLSAYEGNFHKAVKVYEKLADDAVRYKVQPLSLNDFLFLAGIYSLAANDTIATTRALQSYEQMNGSWASSAENRLLHQIVEAIEQGDPGKFDQAMETYNPYAKALKKWNDTMLQKVKANIEEKGEDYS